MSSGAPQPILVFLSGKRRGEAVAPAGDEIRIGIDPAAGILLAEDAEHGPHPAHAVLSRRGSTYELTAEPGQLVWVNGESTERLVLASGDVIEFGSAGPVIRFRLYPPGSRPGRTAPEVFSDCVQCAIRGADTAAGRAGLLMTSLPRDMATRTSGLFRIGVIAVLVTLGASTLLLSRRSTVLEQRLAEIAEGTTLTELVGENGRDLSPPALSALLADLEAEIATTSERLEEIREQAGAASRAIERAAAATILLQGAYGFRDPASQRMVKLVQGPGGRPALGPGGTPMLTADGDGPLLEILYTGTGFVASADGLVLTNRHVAMPWEFDETARRLIERGLEPVMLKFIGYLPDEPRSFNVSVVLSSDDADIAVLSCSVSAEVPFLELSDAVAEPGDEVIVMGYPLGIRALVARTDPAFIEELRAQGGGDFWTVAERLSESHYIGALATRGIVGQRSDRFVVYDAETTSGGSGGPVLGGDGRVVAINAAILPEFGGSNLGVPAARARTLLARARRLTAESARLPLSPSGE